MFCPPKTSRLDGKAGLSNIFPHHYLEDGTEDLGVLGHSAYVELPGEDGRVVVLIVHLQEHLGRVGCDKTIQ